MKIRYLKARNVLSFGDEEMTINFGSNNIIAGPNDAGKTNLFRALRLFENAFGYTIPELTAALFQGDINRPVRLEVGLELNESECALLASQIICHEIAQIMQIDARKQEVLKSNIWSDILIEYGYAILSKSFRNISLILLKDDLSLSEARLIVQMSDNERTLYIGVDRHITTSIKRYGTFVNIFLAETIVKDFASRFKMDEAQQTEVLKDQDRLVQESPTLAKLITEKMEGSTPKAIQLGGYSLEEYKNLLQIQPMTAKLFNLSVKFGADQQRLDVWLILNKFYKDAFIVAQELRTILRPPIFPIEKKEARYHPMAPITGNDLSLTLFNLKNSGIRREREKYNKIQREFKSLTGSEFDIAVKGRQINDLSDESLGVMSNPFVESFPSSNTQFQPLGIGKESRKHIISEAYVQIIKENFPVNIEQAASGVFEILYMLTTIIGETDRILLLDEPELHLHPNMQKRLLKHISDSISCDNNQVITITHSPYFITNELKDTTWRFTRTNEGTKVHNLLAVLKKIDEQEIKKLDISLTNSDIRALLFARGVIFVEGPSDRIVIEQIDAYLSKKGEGTNLAANEWSVIDIGGKKSLSTFLKLSDLLDVPSLCIMDYDALMHKEHKVGDTALYTSSSLFALFRNNKLSEQELIDINKMVPGEDYIDAWYPPTLFPSLRDLSLKQGVFVFSTDLEGQMLTPKTEKRNKPLKDLDRVLELITQDKVPIEFHDMTRFLASRINT